MKKNTTVSEYDKTQVFKDELEPLLMEMKKICRVNNIPFFFSCAPASSEQKTIYNNEGVLTGSLGIDLADDKFEKFLMILRGAELQPLGAITHFDNDAMEYILSGALESEENAEEYFDNGVRFIGEI